MTRFTTIAIAALLATSETISAKIFEARLAARESSLSLDASSSSTDEGYDATTKFESSDCSGTPVLGVVYLGCSTDGYNDTCSLNDRFEASSSQLDEVPYSHVQESCVTDLKTYADESFGDQAYLRLDYYYDTECTLPKVYNMLIADGECHTLLTSSDASSNDAVVISFKVTVNSNGTISYEYYYEDSGCSGEPTTTILATKELLSTNACDSTTGIAMHTNADLESDKGEASAAASSGGEVSSAGVTPTFQVGYVALVVLVIGLVA